MARYWVGGTGTWNGTNTANWSDTSGGAGGFSIPTSVDDVFFDANSGSGTCTIATGNTGCRSLDFTGFTGTYTGSGTLNCRGSLTYNAGMTLSATGSVTMSAADAQTITTNGKTITHSTFFNNTGGSWTLQDDYTADATHTMRLQAGTINANDKNIRVATFTTVLSASKTVNMGSGTWTITFSGFSWSIGTPATNTTVNAGTSTIKLINNSVNPKSFGGGGHTYNNLWIASLGPATTITGSNTFNDFKINAGREVIFTAGTTQTISSLTATGTLGNTISLHSTTAGSAWTLSKSSGQVECDYLVLQDSTATGGALFFAGANSTNVSGNTGWTFSPAGSTNSGFFSFFI